MAWALGQRGMDEAGRGVSLKAGATSARHRGAGGPVRRGHGRDGGGGEQGHARSRGCAPEHRGCGEERTQRPGCFRGALEAQVALKSWGLQRDPSGSGLVAHSSEGASLPGVTRSPWQGSQGVHTLHPPIKKGQTPSPSPVSCVLHPSPPGYAHRISSSHLYTRGDCPEPSGNSRERQGPALTAPVSTAFPTCWRSPQSRHPRGPPAGSSKILLL